MGPRDRRRRRRCRTHAVPIVLVSLLGFLLVFTMAFGIGMLGNVNRWLQNLPNYQDESAYLASEPTKVLDAKGNTIASFFAQNRHSIAQDQVSKYVLNGTVATEDERFYEHGGIDPIGIARAAWVQLTGGSEGASTITQQLVRNTVLSSEQFDKTIERKVREAYIAIKMEDLFSKDKILMMYLNTIYYGHSAYGIEAAAETYFSKSAKDLTLSEAALLVGLPNSPSRYDPTLRPKLAIARRNTVLDRMLKNNYISQKDHDEARAEELKLQITESSTTGVQISGDPYFVYYVKTELRRMLIPAGAKSDDPKAVKKADTEVDNLIFKSGLTVKTTIDPDVEAAANEAVVNQLNKVNLSGLQAGLTAIDPKTGYIKAMVGGRDYNADENHINHALAKRQTGSSFKGFTLACAIKNGMNPNIVLNCNSGMSFPQQGAKPYSVKNYASTNYGNITLRRATEVSSNVGYVQVEQAVGNAPIADYCSKVGINISDQKKSALTMTLGVESLSTLQMAGAYAVFPAGGYYRTPTAITEIDARDGSVLYQHTDDPKQVLDTGVCQVVTDVLKGVITSGTGAAARLSVNQPFAGKTGTTDDVADLYFCGYTPQLSVAVWSGYSSGGIPIRIHGRDALGDDLTLPMAKNFLNKALAGVAREEFPTGTPPTYKPNSVWEQNNKKISVNDAAPKSNASEKDERSAAPSTHQPSTDDGQDTTGGDGDGGDGDGDGGDTPAPSPDTNPSPSTPSLSSHGGEG